MVLICQFIFSIQKMNVHLRLERPAKFNINQLDSSQTIFPKFVTILFHQEMYHIAPRIVTVYLQYIQQIIKIMREKTELIIGPHQLISEHEKEKRCVRTKQPTPRYY